MKTKKQWDESSKNLFDFLQVGDEVDETIKMYFLETLPPATWTGFCIQMGEPYTHNNLNQPMFSTLEKQGGQWVYTGIKTRPKHWQKIEEGVLT